jgi:predicted ATPase/class 3 adenylate cyclase
VSGGRRLPTGTVTFLFTDIEGSTKLLRRLGDGYPAILAEHHRILLEAVEAGGGTRVSTEGDAVFAVFPDAPSALGSAVAAQRGLAGRDWGDGTDVRVRMGLHTGQGMVADGDYVGIDVHRAARIAGAGHGGQVLVSDATRALVEQSLPPAVTLMDLGPHRLKDLAEPEHLYQAVASGLRVAFPPLRSLDARPTNLPSQLTSFIGRDREVAEVRRLLSGARLVTLTGPGGTGKTRLSLQVAAESVGDFADGVFFVPLASITDPALVASTVAVSLRIQELGEHAIDEILQEYLRDREMLLVLDNFEQVVAASSLVSALLAAAPRLRAMVTSRERLHLSGEQEYSVPPLGLPDPANLPPLEALSQYEAVALFIQRARAVDPSFAVTDANAPAVAEICVRLDGLPLAIELAAARSRILPPDALLGRLGEKLRLLRGGARDLPARQQTLRDAIAWSYDLLEPDEQRRFRQLGVFMGGWTVDAADRVTGAGPEGDALDELESLVDKSLARATESAQGEPRFWMLETIREFAAERLLDAGEAADVADRHAAYYLAFAERSEPRLTRDAAVLDRVQAEHDNLRAALQWSIDTGEAATGLRIGGALWRFWHLRGHFTEGRAKMAELLALPAATGVARGRGLLALGSLVYWQGDYDMAEASYEEAKALFEAASDDAGAAESAYDLAYIAGVKQDLPLAERRFEEARGLYERVGDELGVANTLMGVALSPWLQGDSSRLREVIDQTIPIYRRAGDAFGLANALSMLARADVDDGLLEEALPNYLESIDLFEEIGDLSGLAFSLDDLAELFFEQKDRERALRLAGAADAMRESLGAAAPRTLVRSFDTLGQALRVMDEAAVAKAWEEGRAMSMEQALAYLRGEPTEAPGPSSGPGA